MRKGRILITGSFLLGIITILIVYFSLGLTGVIRTQVKDITIVSEGKTQLYDSTTVLTNPVIQDVEGLYEGDYVVPTFTGSQLNAGSSDNTFSCKIYDSKDFDVTDNYNINYVYGTLIVNPRTININIKSYEKIYDGTPLAINESHTITASTFNNYINDSITSISGNGLVSNDTINVNISGSTTEPDSRVNLDISYKITNKTNIDVSSNYTVNIINGTSQTSAPTLSVFQHPLTISSNDYKKEYDGLPLSMETYNGKGYGIEGSLYDGDILTVNFTSVLDTIGEMDNDFTYTITDVTGNDVSNKYSVSKKLGTLEITTRKLYLSYKETVDYQQNIENPDFNDVVVDTNNLTQFNDNFIINGNLSIDSETSLPGKYNVDFNDITISNENNEDVTSNFEIITDKDRNNNTVENTYTINPIVIQVSPNIDTIVTYDSLSHSLSLENYTYDKTLLLDNHTLVDTYKIQAEDNQVLTEAINAGTYTFVLALKVVDQGGNDCSDYYQFEYIKNQFNQETAKLIIQKATLEYSIMLNQSNTKEYDGVEVKPSDLDYSISNVKGLVGNDKIDDTKTVLSSKNAILEIGSYDIICNPVILAQNDDVTDNYNCVLKGNSIEYIITKINIKISDKTLESTVYDGKNHPFTLDSLNIADLTKIQSLDHNYVMDVKEGSKTPNYCDATDHSYTVTLIITDGQGKNITSEYYNINTGTVYFTITKREISIKSHSVTKGYDASEVSSDKYNFVSGSVAEGQSIVVKSNPSFINAGIYDNKIEIDIVNDADNQSVIQNYNVKISYGTLTINKRLITITSSTDSKVYDGKALISASCDTPSNLLSTHEIDVTSKSSIINAGHCYNEIAIDIVDKITKDSVIENYDVTLLYGTLTITKKSITLETATEEKVYDGLQLSAGTITKGLTELINEDKAVVNTESVVSITNVGSCINKFDIDILSGEESVLSNYDITWKYGTLTISKKSITLQTATKEKVYDGTELYDTTITKDDTALVNGHILSISNESVPTLTNVGTCLNKFNINILSGQESVLSNYDITWNYGTLTITKKSITLGTQTLEKVYDGTELTNSSISMNENTIITGQNITVDSDTVPTITNVGTCLNKFDINILSGQTSVLGNYDITWEYGTLTITKRSITLTTVTKEKVYDGTQLTDSTVTVSGNTIPTTQSLVVDSKTVPSIINAGTCLNKFNIDIVSGETSVISNYDITWECGTLTISKRAIYLVTQSASKMYDGKPLSCLETEQVVSSQLNTYKLADNQIINYVSGSSIIEVGACANILNIQILDSFSADVTSNYDITWDFGTLTIVENPNLEKDTITVRPARISMVYNGSSYIGTPTLVFSGDILGSYKYSYSTDGIIVPKDKEIGTYTVTINEELLKLVITDADGQVITNKFTIRYEDDYLVICRAQLEVKESNQIVKFDGNVHSFDVTNNSEANITKNWTSYVDGFNSSNYKITVNPVEGYVSDTITNPGRIQNNWFTITVTDLAGNDVTSEFNIVYKYASLVITKDSLIIESCSYDLDENASTYEYFKYTDGTETRNVTSEQLTTLIKDKYNLSFDFGFIFTANQTASGECDNTFEIENITQLSELFSITTIYGKLTKS